MNLCSGRAHLNSPGRLVYICLLDKSGLRLADNRSPDQFHYLPEISRHWLVQSGPLYLSTRAGATQFIP
jgi:hypothetical protein